MVPPHETLGVLVPIGGGDPIPLKKVELLIGRRAICDIQLDYENVSGKHCVLRMNNGVWSIRDLGSTNGTTVNGSRIGSEHTLMPDDEVGIAGHFYNLNYEPSGPEAFMGTRQVFDNDVVEDRPRHSLMELAGLDTDGNKPKRAARPARAPEEIERLSADEAEFEDSVPDHFEAKPKPKAESKDVDFFKLIEDEIVKSD
jgi:predicted component of type VI protein secretion system